MRLNKRTLIIAAIVLAVVVVICVAALALNGFDFGVLKYETKTYETDGMFTDIEIARSCAKKLKR